MPEEEAMGEPGAGEMGVCMHADIDIHAYVS